MGRLQADQAAEGGRHADRAARVDADRESETPGSDRRRRPAARSSGRQPRVEWIVHAAHKGIETPAELIHVRRADEHRSRQTEPCHDVGLSDGSAVSQKRRAAGSCHAGNQQRVLDRHGDACERTGILSACKRLVDLPRLRDRRLSEDRREGVQLRLTLLDLVDREPGQLDGRQVTRAQAPAQLADRQVRQGRHTRTSMIEA